MINGSSEYFGNVKQISPAPGWEAVYTDDNGEILTEPLACWAVVEWKGDKGGTIVSGMVADTNAEELEFASSVINFLGFKGPGDTRDWKEIAKEHFIFKKATEA